jgi:hypothetical protein
MKRAIPSVLVLFAVCLSETGCSKKVGGASATISGKVTYKGRPLTGGTMFLWSKEDVKFPVDIDGLGNFSMTDVPVGEATVTFDTDWVKGREKSAGTSGKGIGGPVAFGGKSAPAAAPLKYVKLPAKYTNRNQSKLTWDIKPGAQSKDFELTD